MAEETAHVETCRFLTDVLPWPLAGSYRGCAPWTQHTSNRMCNKEQEMTTQHSSVTSRGDVVVTQH